MAERGTAALRGHGFPAGGVFNAALDAVVVMSADGLVRDWNQAATRIFGYTYAEAVGRELAELIIPPQLRERHRMALARVVETGRSTLIDRRIEMTAMRSRGTTFPVELTITRVPDADPPLFAGFVRDLSAQRRAEAQRKGLERRLELLAEATARLDRSLDLEQILKSLVDMVVPELADVAVVMVGGEHGLPRAVATAPERAEVRRHVDAIVNARSAGHPVFARVARTGASALLADIPHEDPSSNAADRSAVDLLGALGARSAVLTPLTALGRTLGVLVLVRLNVPPYHEQDRAFAEDLARRAALSIDNARLYDEMRHIATSLQSRLLPAALPAIPGARLAARYKAAGSAQLVGGDFYDCFPIGQGQWGIVIGDVCGKGPDAAALTALARFTVRGAAIYRSDPPAVLRALNHAVRRELGPEGRFVTAVYGTLAPDRGRLVVSMAAAGHPPPLVLTGDGAVRPLDTAGTLLGIDRDFETATAEVILVPGDLLLLYTDGLTDAGAPARILTESDLCELLSGWARRDASAVADHLTDATLGNAARRDDVALVVIESVEEPG